MWRNVFLLGLLSFFNDLSADMITPLLPAFLASMGMGAAFLGVMEGVANALSHVTTLFSGWLDDRWHRSKKLAVMGYALCAIARPLIAIPAVGATLSVRFLDRFGKGIRTAPRDHLLTRSTDRKSWGRAFGMQRAFDHAGALIGPPVAALLLKFTGFSYSQIFLVAAVPALLSILIVPWFIREPPRQAKERVVRISWKALPPSLRRYLGIILLSALSTPSELFLILKLQSAGMPAYSLPLAWAVLTAATMIAAYLGGELADRWGQRRSIALGWSLFCLVFIAFGLDGGGSWSWVLIFIYGFQSGLVEAAERVYPANLVPPEIRASAMGWYYLAYGLGLMPASILFGFLWARISPAAAFLIFAGMSLATVPLLALLPTARKSPEKLEASGRFALR